MRTPTTVSSPSLSLYLFWVSVTIVFNTQLRSVVVVSPLAGGWCLSVALLVVVDPAFQNKLGISQGQLLKGECGTVWEEASPARVETDSTSTCVVPHAEILVATWFVRSKLARSNLQHRFVTCKTSTNKRAGATLTHKTDMRLESFCDSADARGAPGAHGTVCVAVVCWL